MYQDKKAIELLQIAERAFTCRERNNATKVWRNIARFVLQSADGPFYGEKFAKGDIKHQECYDAAPGQFNRDLANAIHSTITNPAMRWSKFKYRNENLNNDTLSLSWLDHGSEAIHSELNDSNFDTQVGTAYLSFTGLGTMVLLQEELYDDDGEYKGLNFTNIHIGEVALQTNARNIVDTLYRKFTLTPKQAYEKFPEEKEYLEMMMKGDQNEELEFIHCIKPRRNKDIRLNSVGLAPPEKRPYASIYIDARTAKIVKEDGYYEKPFFAPRWAVRPGETYGFGPGHTAMPDILSMNKIRKETLRGLAKAINPYIIETERNILAADLRPGGKVTVRKMDGFKEGATATRFEVAFNTIEDYKNSIKSCFYIDKLMLPPRNETGEMTAYEVAQRLEQMQQILGPVVSRLNAEFLQDLVMRTYKILRRHGKILPAPNRVQKTGADVDIMFVNSLARSQQLSELRNVQTWVREVAETAQVNPKVLDKVDWDALVEYNARIRSIPESILISDAEVEKIRKERDAQMQAAQMLQAGEQVGNIMKNINPKGG